jgi:Predicted polymerase, most proteins contain PALM domain, HD hydrolase domain and Zn-ribbon domain
MKKVYCDSTVEKCLYAASCELNIPVKELTYKVLEEKKSFFKKKATIEVELFDENIVEEGLEKSENIEEEEKCPQLNENDGTVEITDGKIIIRNPEEGGNPATILVGNDVKVIIDGEEVKGKKAILKGNKIEIIFSETTASRELKITLSQDNMEAYATINYEPQYKYKLKDKKKSVMAILESEIESQINPPKYTTEEVKKELNNNKVVYGIIEENLKQSVKNGGMKLLIAKGQQVVNGTNDNIELKFQTNSNSEKLKEDEGGNIDFKSIGSVEAVHKGDVIAVKHQGEEGQDGCDITGRVKKHKAGKKVKLKVGEGCILTDENTIAAAVDGKPCIKSNAFYVYQIHEVRSDVDLKTGNIKFIGDIVVYGSVKEGMEIECGNYLDIEKDVERAKIKAAGNINIKGNLIAGNIFAGGEDVKKLKALKDLVGLKEQIVELIQAVGEIKKFNLLGQNKKDGEVVKILIENKYKMLPKLCISVVTDLKLQDDDSNIENYNRLTDFIRSKLLGIAPISIQHYSELDLIVSSIEEIIVELKNTLSIPVNVKISYSQDSNIQSSGDIVITGRGEYISDITANGSIYFLQEKSVARGGILRAKEEIKCRVVGSTAGVSTKLQVEKQGHIWVDTAYQNTIFSVGNREIILDVPSKNIHAYIDSNDDIIVDKLKL